MAKFENKKIDCITLIYKMKGVFDEKVIKDIFNIYMSYQDNTSILKMNVASDINYISITICKGIYQNFVEWMQNQESLYLSNEYTDEIILIEKNDFMDDYIIVDDITEIEDLNE